MEYIVCKSCNVSKLKNEFPPNKSNKHGIQSKCKPCYAAYQKEYYRQRIKNDQKYRLRKAKWRKQRQRKKVIEQQKFILNYLYQHPCTHCQETDPIVLEFDHIDPKTKLFNISDAASKEINLDKLKKEIDKCQILCSNCHLRKTAKQFNYTRWQLIYGK